MSRRPVPRTLRLAVKSAEPPTSDGPVTEEAGALAVSVAKPKPRPAPVPKPTPLRPDQPAPKPVERPAALRSLVALVAVTAALAGLAGWAFWADHQAARTDQARRDGLAVAVASAEVILSYDYRHLDTDVSAATRRTTGDFRTEYADTSKTIAPVARQYKAVVRATVKAASVVRAQPDRVVTLLFVDQSTQSTRVAGTKIDQARVRLTVIRVGHDWRVAKVEAL